MKTLTPADQSWLIAIGVAPPAIGHSAAALRLAIVVDLLLLVLGGVVAWLWLGPAIAWAWSLAPIVWDQVVAVVHWWATW